MNGGNPEFFDEADKICGIVFDRALLIVHGVLIRLGEASTVGVWFPFTASAAPPCASIIMGGRERANLTRPRQARLTAATLSRSITILHFPHQSFLSSRLSDWSLSPHLGQVTLDPLV